MKEEKPKGSSGQRQMDRIDGETEKDVREWLTRKGSIASEEPCPPPLYESSSHETLMNPQTLRTLSFQASCSATLLLFLSSQILNRMKFSSRFSSLSPQQPYVTLQSPYPTLRARCCFHLAIIRCSLVVPDFSSARFAVQHC